MVAVDMNLSDDATLAAFQMAREYNKRICVDPTSTERAYRLRPHLHLLNIITPNIAEAEAILGCRADPRLRRSAPGRPQAGRSGRGHGRHHPGRARRVLRHGGRERPVPRL